MRFREFATIKPIKPMSPAQARIASGKKRVDQAKQALKTERDYQKHHNEREAQAKKQRRG